ncbi:nucleotidyltransferase family protein [Exiguobacterium sp. s152]|uniref:nucleotidyltransferase family protein n=1 Tax=Exiguobacterium sp. s152 TaxID=2751226 RepID=UPI001BE77B59|nr:nucleotidyltransferase family protein [Exiguobacterium sp. s152]
MKTIEEVTHFLENDSELRGLLKDVASLELPDWWICAGYVRAKIWDDVHGYPTPTPTEDVDVIYFDRSQIDEAIEKEYEAQLHVLSPTVPWSVKNQARMHLVNQLPPYQSAIDALAHFPETVTAIGVSLDANDRLIVAAPYGVDDIIELRLRPTPAFADGSPHHHIYQARIQNKNWQAIWPKLQEVDVTRHGL